MGGQGHIPPVCSVTSLEVNVRLRMHTMATCGSLERPNEHMQQTTKAIFSEDGDGRTGMLILR